MSKYTIELTEVQSKALHVIAANPEEWIDNFVTIRCEQAIEEIFQTEVQRLISEGKPISGTKEEIVLAADVETALERNIRLLQESEDIKEVK